MDTGWDFAETKAVGYIGGDANVQNQLDGIIRNKAIYQKVADAMTELQLHVAAISLKVKNPVLTWVSCKH